MFKNGLTVNFVVEYFTCLDFAGKSQRGTGDRKARACANTGEKILGSGAFKWYG